MRMLKVLLLVVFISPIVKAEDGSPCKYNVGAISSFHCTMSEPFVVKDIQVLGLKNEKPFNQFSMSSYERIRLFSFSQSPEFMKSLPVAKRHVEAALDASKLSLNDRQRLIDAMADYDVNIAQIPSGDANQDYLERSRTRFGTVK